MFLNYSKSKVAPQQNKEKPRQGQRPGAVKEFNVVSEHHDMY
jgi:hypothetical protein